MLVELYQKQEVWKEVFTLLKLFFKAEIQPGLLYWFQ